MLYLTVLPAGVNFDVIANLSPSHAEGMDTVPTDSEWY